MQVVGVPFVFDREVAEVVGGALNHAWFGAAAGYPHGKAEGVVIAPGVDAAESAAMARSNTDRHFMRFALL